MQSLMNAIIDEYKDEDFDCDQGADIV